jgi:hypothetical protein
MTFNSFDAAGKLSRPELARNIFIEIASLLLAACALWVFVLARLAGGLVAGFVQEDYGWLLGLLSALLVGTESSPFDTASPQPGQGWLSTCKWIMMVFKAAFRLPRWLRLPSHKECFA